MKQVWPSTRQLLCFITCKGGGRWLWEKKQEIDLEDRKDIMQLVRKLVYAASPLELSEIYHDITILLSWFLYILMLRKEYEIRKWALIHRSDLTTRGKHTNNF